MSTSYSPAPQAKTETKPEPEPEVSAFPYVEAGTSAAGAGSAAPGAGRGGIFLSPEDLTKREETAREAGRQEGEARARGGFEQQLERTRENLRRALEDFARERGQYYQQVETEVVQLALSIARKVLHREARADPMLLAGLVRVALDQMESHTKVLIRVHPQYAADCRDYFSRCMDAHEVPEVVEDPALDPDRTVLETALGTTEIGIDVQLKEIEQGLMDLLAQRPQSGR
jgi:flagellar assembly protein FliH